MRQYGDRYSKIVNDLQQETEREKKGGGGERRAHEMKWSKQSL